MEDKKERLEKIRQNFLKIKQANYWCQQNFPEFLVGDEKISLIETKNQQFLHSKLLPALEVIYSELEELGVSRVFSGALFILGTVDVRQLAEQFGV